MRRPWLLPLVPLYRAGLRVADALRAKPEELAWPVISVGSLSAGGAGKTPVVKALGSLLERHGLGVDVLSRGYGRTSSEVLRVDPEGDAARYGDEPLEMAKAGLAVWVGANRFAAGAAAERAWAALPMSQHRDLGRPAFRVHVLDDGLQHRRLARTLDIVLLTLQEVRDALLPAGNLREPLTALRRADAIVLREDEAQQVLAACPALLQGKPVWIVRRRLRLQVPAHALLAFCGLARPEGFFAMLGSVAGTVAFRDHHRYRAADVRRLAEAARQAGARGFITTVKDAVKLTGELRAILEQAGPVHVAELETSFLDEQAVWNQLATALRK